MKKIIYIMFLILFVGMLFVPTAQAKTEYPVAVDLGNGQYAIGVGWSPGSVIVHRDSYVYACNLISPRDTSCTVISVSTATTAPDGVTRWLTTDNDVLPWIGVSVFSYPISQNYITYDIGYDLYYVIVIVASVAFAYAVLKWVGRLMGAMKLW